MGRQLVMRGPPLTRELPLAGGLSRNLADCCLRTCNLGGERRLVCWLRREWGLGQEARRVRLWGWLRMNLPVGGEALWGLRR